MLVLTRGEVVFRISSRTQQRRAFTLLEVVLAIGLCGAVMALLTTAIDLYLVRVDTSRTQVESAELARALLTKIADDIRAVRYSSASVGLPSTTGSSGSGGETGGGEAGSGDTSGTTGNSALSSTSNSDLGIYGTLTELRIDRSAQRSWRQVAVPTEQQQLQTTDVHDLPMTVEYYFEQGRTLATNDLAAGGVGENTLLAGYTGLYYRRTPTVARMMMGDVGFGTTAEGSTSEPSELLAPEVVEICFMYYDGTQWLEEWDSSVQEGLPVAIEIKLSLFRDILGTDEPRRQVDEVALRRDQTRWVEYRLVVRVPPRDKIPELSGPATEAPQNTFLQGGQDGL
jgi:type II secretory pathway pseudopilin PulG